MIYQSNEYRIRRRANKNILTNANQLVPDEEEGVAGDLERVRDHVARRPFKLPLRVNLRGHLPKREGV